MRRLKTWVHKEFSTRDTYNWLNILQKITKHYNSKADNTVGMWSIDVTPTTQLIVYNLKLMKL